MAQTDPTPRGPSRPQMIFAGACVGLALLIGAGAWLGTRSRDQGPQVSSTGSAALGGPFHLTDQNGKPQTEALLKGKWTAVFFGYTYCPNYCPLTLQMLGAAQDQLGPRGKDLQIVFISVDPERDTPAQLKLYLTNQGFPKGAVALTGSAAQVAEAAKAYKVYYSREGTGSDYLVDHTNATYLMNPQGRFVKIIAYGMAPDATAGLIRDAMRGG